MGELAVCALLEGSCSRRPVEKSSRGLGGRGVRLLESPYRALCREVAEIGPLRSPDPLLQDHAITYIDFDGAEGALVRG